MIEPVSPELQNFYDIFDSVDKSKIPEFKDFLEANAVNFNLFKEGNFIERSFPFDMIPRIIPKKEFDHLEAGIVQRVKALNAFLNDVYGEQRIIKDGIVPREYIDSAVGFLPTFMGVVPSRGIRTHISGIDLVKDSVSGEWVILEDNLRVPSGVSYPLTIRRAFRHTYPEFFESMKISKIKQYGDQLKAAMKYVNTGGLNVVLTPGRYNSAYYEHSYLAKITGATLALGEDLVVENNEVFLCVYNGERQRVGAIYRRLDDDFLDPEEFDEESLIGVPHLASAYRAGNVAIMNSIGNGVADDKGIYYFVPQMVKYYLDEEPLLKNAPTYLPYYEKDREYVLANIDKLVIKDVAEAGGYGVLFGNRLTPQERANIIEMILENPRRFIAQEVIEFYDLPCMIEGKILPRKADLRAYVIYGEEVSVSMGGLTRYAMEEGNYLVNSSQGGGFKDTWVVEL
ncbi:MAG: circularly permuted type 2 ATP-grasp protein [Sulfuricurvum sp.]|nr:circularly permuted type 2 ATP-grasp protein [Sulfuricurvum sp.]MDD5387366.1 circularly permuted type 2 ATP-grasp protein [Sulfuricurvum sp.]